MPDSYMLNAGMFLADEIDCMLESVRECLSFSLELNPAVLELAVSTVVNGLPIVVNNEIRDVDFVLR